MLGDLVYLGMLTIWECTELSLGRGMQLPTKVLSTQGCSNFKNMRCSSPVLCRPDQTKRNEYKAHHAVLSRVHFFPYILALFEKKIYQCMNVLMEFQP